jgi:glycerate kinase
MNILIACDSFKDAISSRDACRAIQRGLIKSIPQADIRIFPLSDGGEGFTDILNEHLGLFSKSIVVHDPLMRTLETQYSMTRDGKIAYMEMARSSGLQLLRLEERNPLLTNSFGLGEMILDALKQGCEKVVIGLGGSATHDLGTGMASALGWQFFDIFGHSLLPNGSNLLHIKNVVAPEINPWSYVEFEGLSDVTHTLLGPLGAAHTFAKQKGATPEMIEILESGSHNLANILPNGNTTKSLEYSGSAGGLGFGLRTFLNAKIHRGIDAILAYSNFDSQAQWADIIITGEGRLDRQTMGGKLISGIIKHAFGKPVIALCGSILIDDNEISMLGLQGAYPISHPETPLEEALKATSSNLELKAHWIGNMLQSPGLGRIW